jgi:hypothetical protein
MMKVMSGRLGLIAFQKFGNKREMTNVNEEDLIGAGIPQFIIDCPVVCQWLEFKGETYFGILNYERSIKAHRPMIDLSYCATQAMNAIVIKTVQYSEKHFKKSKLEMTDGRV